MYIPDGGEPPRRCIKKQNLANEHLLRKQRPDEIARYDSEAFTSGVVTAVAVAGLVNDLEGILDHASSIGKPLKDVFFTYAKELHNIARIIAMGDESIAMQFLHLEDEEPIPSHEDAMALFPQLTDDIAVGNTAFGPPIALRRHQNQIRPQIHLRQCGRRVEVRRELGVEGVQDAHMDVCRIHIPVASPALGAQCVAILLLMRRCNAILHRVHHGLPHTVLNGTRPERAQAA